MKPSKTLTIPSAGKIQRNCSPSAKMMGAWNGTATLGDNSACSYKAKPILNTWPSNPAPRRLPLKNENLYLYKTPYADSISIHNCPRREATQMSFKEWTDKLWQIYTTRELSAKKKKKKGTNYWYMLQLNEQQRSQSHKVTYCIIPFIWHSWKRQSNGEQISCRQKVKLREGYDYRGVTRGGFWADGINLYPDCGGYTYLKIHRNGH